MSKQPPPAPTASTIGPCPTIIQIVGRPGTGSSPRTIAPPDHPMHSKHSNPMYHNTSILLLQGRSERSLNQTEMIFFHKIFQVGACPNLKDSSFYGTFSVHMYQT